MALLFFLSLALISYAYIGYPLSLMAAGWIRRRDVTRRPFVPFVTVIVTAYNEEKKILPKLENTFALDYPRERLQVLVASDGSTDRTNGIVRGFAARGVELLEIKERRGKENAQMEAVRRARGDVLVFTDVATMLEPGGLARIVSNFADPGVGCVSSEDRLIGQDGRPTGEGFYVRYEMWLRRLESRVNSLVGLSGSFFAARKEVCKDFSNEMQSDFRTVLNSARLGLRGISDPGAVGYYQDISDGKKEFRRKVRTVLRGLTVFFRNLEFLNPFRYGFFSYQYFCHKLLRWLVPVFLCLGLISNLVLAWGSGVFLVLLCCQFAFYGIAAWGWTRNVSGGASLLRIPVYFVTVNASIFVAWWKYLTGERIVMWTPTER